MLLEITYLFLLGHFHDMRKTIGLGYGILKGGNLSQVIPFATHIEMFERVFRDIHQCTVVVSIGQGVFFILEIQVC